MKSRELKALVAGWFSFEQMGASAGDLLVRDVVCDWLSQAGCPYDVAVAPPFIGGVNWTSVDPGSYSHVVFVCGPFGNGPPITEFLERFQGIRLVGVNLTMLESLETWNPFDLLLERDSSAVVRPDLSFLSTAPLVPVAGLALIDSQPEYGERDLHVRANAALRRLAASRDIATIEIDTRLDTNVRGLGSAAQVESLIARTDVILTTRLHGTVLALKNAVPVVAVDPVANGGKVLRQCRVVDWPMVFLADADLDDDLPRALDYCLTNAARTKARECGRRAGERLQQVAQEFIAALEARQTTRRV